MSDLFAEIAKRRAEVRAEYPDAPDVMIDMRVRFDAAYARGDNETADHFAPLLVAVDLASRPWWHWPIKPRLWLAWLCLKYERY